MRPWVGLLYGTLLESVRWLTIAMLVALVAVVSAAVVVRYFGLFGGSLHWANELTRFSIVWVAMLGSVIAFDRGAHVAIDIFQDSLSKRARRVVAGLSYLLATVFILALAWYGFELAFATMRQHSPALGIPMGYVYLSIPVGASIMALQSVLFAIWPDLRIGADPQGPDNET